MKICFEQPNKKRYSTQKGAETAILLLGKPELRAYKCSTCDGWHLTSQDENKK